MLLLLRRMHDQRPLQLVLLIAAILRITAAFFLRGYGMHDDHFLLIEAAQSFVDGADYNNWLPWNQSQPAIASGHSWFYVGFHYLLFKFLEFFNITQPISKIVVLHLIHGLYSLLTVYFSYKISALLYSSKIAFTTGILTAILWVLPSGSVLSLVEITCIPPILASFWILLKNKGDKSYKTYIIAGFVIGFSLGFRIQCALIIAGVSFALLLQKRIGQAIVYGVFSLLAFSITQLGDLFIWGKPFIEITEYIQYNMTHSGDYMSLPWYKFILDLQLLIIPPVGLFLIFGFIRNWRKALLITIPTTLFFVFHSYYPNKQIRFIITILPMIIIVGTGAWIEFKEQSKFWAHRARFYNALILFFLIINSTFLFPLLFVYSKKSRVESMIHLSHKTDLINFTIDSSLGASSFLAPQYYLNSWKKGYKFQFDETSLTAENIRNQFDYIPDSLRPNYIIFAEDLQLKRRLAVYKEAFPSLQYDATITPGFIDDFLHRLNPYNRNYTNYIYKIVDKKN